MEIYITGDLHGDLRRFQPEIFYEQEGLTKCESIVKRRKRKTNDAARMRMTLWKKNSSNYTAPFANAMIADFWKESNA